METYHYISFSLFTINSSLHKFLHFQTYFLHFFFFCFKKQFMLREVFNICCVCYSFFSASINFFFRLSDNTIFFSNEWSRITHRDNVKERERELRDIIDGHLDKANTVLKRDRDRCFHFICWMHLSNELLWMLTIGHGWFCRKLKGLNEKLLFRPDDELLLWINFILFKYMHLVGSLAVFYSIKSIIQEGMKYLGEG